MKYYLYILRCSDNSLYCGMTSNLERRIKEHNSTGARGAKYLRARKPVKLVYKESFLDIQSAMSREVQIKKLKKTQKEALVSGESHLLIKL